MGVSGDPRRICTDFASDTLYTYQSYADGTSEIEMDCFYGLSRK